MREQSVFPYCRWGDRGWQSWQRSEGPRARSRIQVFLSQSLSSSLMNSNFKKKKNDWKQEKMPEVGLSLRIRLSSEAISCVLIVPQNCDTIHSYHFWPLKDSSGPEPRKSWNLTFYNGVYKGARRNCFSEEEHNIVKTDLKWYFMLFPSASPLFPSPLSFWTLLLTLLSEGSRVPELRQWAVVLGYKSSFLNL